MDPYLEPHWPDVHSSLIAEARRALNRSLPKGLVARAEEGVAIESDDNGVHQVGPDVRVFSPSTADPDEGAGGIIIVAPFKLVLELDPLIERDVRIIDEGGQLITVIEFISPWNKRQPGLDAFREKRVGLLSGGVNVVEIDLVRAGNWRQLMRPEICPHDGQSLYRVVIRTGGRRPAGYLFPIGLSEVLPEIPVPLRKSEEPLVLPLQPLLNSVYADGRYEQTLDYSQPLDPPLTDEDAVWAKQVVVSRRE
jgi:hypothetical protein